MNSFKVLSIVLKTPLRIVLRVNINCFYIINQPLTRAMRGVFLTKQLLLQRLIFFLVAFLFSFSFFLIKKSILSIQPHSSLMCFLVTLHFIKISIFFFNYFSFFIHNNHHLLFSFILKICKEKKTKCKINSIGVILKVCFKFTRSLYSKPINLHSQSIHSSGAKNLAFQLHQKLLYLFYLYTYYSSRSILAFNIIK